MPEERRVIEQKLSSGTLCAVISTSALELGIDIGGLDLCILVGYPGTVMTTWQRGGRVGRSGRESAIVLIPDQDALDQYIVNHPDRFLESRYENAVIDPFNSEILKAHLPCAAAELPICSSDDDFLEEKFSKALNELTSSGRLIQTFEGDQWICAARGPHRLIDIRSVGPSYTITTASNGQTSTLGKNEGIRALQGMPPRCNLPASGRNLFGRIARSRKEVDPCGPGERSLFYTRCRQQGNRDTGEPGLQTRRELHHPDGPAAGYREYNGL